MRFFDLRNNYINKKIRKNKTNYKNTNKLIISLYIIISEEIELKIIKKKEIIKNKKSRLKNIYILIKLLILKKISMNIKIFL